MKRVLELVKRVVDGGYGGLDTDRVWLSVHDDVSLEGGAAILLRAHYGSLDGGNIAPLLELVLDKDERRWLAYELLAIDPPPPLVLGEQPIPDAPPKLEERS